MTKAVWFEALRVRQWHKNLLVFVPILFAFKIADLGLIGRAALLFAAFCAASSAAYLFNDIRDREADRNHPLKRGRPLASGAVAPGSAIVAAVGLLFASFFLAWFAHGLRSVAIILVYLGLQGAYNLGLRALAVADVIVIAMGFVLRAAAGADVIEVPFSAWLLVCVFFGALRLAVGKRQAELRAGRTGLRRGWEEYDENELRTIGGILVATLLVAYTLYCFTSHTAGIIATGATPPLLATLPFALFGLLRYERLAASGAASEPEMILVRDPQIVVAIVGWALLSFTALYLWRGAR
jgi:4-hydroxybenzoate polyprenyltransferase